MLGWLLNGKGEGPGGNVRFLGAIVDAVAREFRVPEAKKLKTLALINGVCEASREGVLVSSKQLARLAGIIASLRIAIPSASVWTRVLYRTISSVDSDSDTLVRVSLECSEDLSVFARLLIKQEGAPLMNFSHELDLWTDAGETGWGAQTLGTFAEGVFDTGMIGTSSTFRELSALIAAVQDPSLTRLLSGKVVRVNMDSACGVANLVKGGGPKPHLSLLVKKWFFICDTLNIRAVYRWVSRETLELKQVDELSKSTEVSLSREGLSKLSPSVQGDVDIFALSKLGYVINTVVARGSRINILVPRWEAKAWWPIVATTAVLVPCPSEFLVFSGAGGRRKPNWDFFIACFL